MSQVLNDLIAARDLLVKDGWTKDHLRKGEAHCAVGAIIDAVTPGACMDDGGAYADDAMRPRVADALHELGKRVPSVNNPWFFVWGLRGADLSFGRDWDAVVAFNNGTFEESVLDLFNNTIAALSEVKAAEPILA